MQHRGRSGLGHGRSVVDHSDPVGFSRWIRWRFGGETNFRQDTIQPIQCPLRDRHSSSEWEKDWSREVSSSPQVFLAKGLSLFRNYSYKIYLKIYLLNIKHRLNNFLVSDGL